MNKERPKRERNVIRVNKGVEAAALLKSQTERRDKIVADVIEVIFKI